MIQFQCSCGKVLKVRPEYESRKLQCPACESLIRIRRSGQSRQAASADQVTSTPENKLGKKAKSKAASVAKQERQPVVVPEDDFEEIEYIDDLELIEDEDDFDELDDFAFADEVNEEEFAPVAVPGLPQARKRKKPVKEKAAAKKKARDDSESIGAGLPPKILIPLFGFAGLVLVGIVALAFSYIKSSSEAYARSQAIPETFSEWRHEKGILSSEYPSGFLVSSGVAAGGVAPWAKFELEEQDIVIMVRASMTGSAISDILNVPAEGTPEQLEAMEIQSLREVHNFQLEKMRVEYDSYEETNTRMLDCKLGKGMVSQFNGSKLLLRATLLGSQYQYNVICKCPADRIEAYTPVFERVIKSVGG